MKNYCLLFLIILLLLPACTKQNVKKDPVLIEPPEFTYYYPTYTIAYKDFVMIIERGEEEWALQDLMYRIYKEYPRCMLSSNHVLKDNEDKNKIDIVFECKEEKERIVN